MILVPFSPEAVLSGVNRKLLPDQFLHYERTFTAEPMENGKRLILHFCAAEGCSTEGQKCRRNGIRRLFLAHTGPLLY